MSTVRDLQLANRAKRHGSRYSLRIVWQARKSGIPISLGFALIEQESGFRNVFGHDPTIFVGAGVVTRSKYRAYKHARGHDQMQGVGPAQLTWWAFQDQADLRGGCWRPKHNISVAFDHLAHLIAMHGERAGIRAYNGTGPAADTYARLVLERQRAWHRRLT